MTYLYHIYVIITACWTAGWWVTNKIAKIFPKSEAVKLLLFFAPPGYLMNFFSLMLIFAAFRVFQDIPLFPNYPEETLEFLLGMGIAISAYLNFKMLRKPKFLQ